MKIIYLIVKYLTLPGTFLQAFFEHLTCRAYEVLVEDGRYLRANEMCGHIQHELVRKRSVSFGLCFFPFLFNLVVGLVLTAAGAVPVLYLGEWFTAGGSVHLLNFLFLWVGVSALTNLFPQTEDALTLKALLYGKETRPNLFLRILASPLFAVLYAGSYLQKWGVTLLTSAAFAYLYPYLLSTFLPQLYNAVR